MVGVPADRSSGSLESDDRLLVDRAQRHADMEAFSILYRRYVGRIHGFAYRRSGSSAVADDVTSATFERALRSIGSFRWRGGGFPSWLFRIAANELADHYRRERRVSKAHETAAMTFMFDSETPFADEVDTSMLRAALDRLRPRYQQAIALRYLSGLSNEEAAGAMGISRPLMAVTLHRALASLRRALQAEGAA